MPGPRPLHPSLQHPKHRAHHASASVRSCGRFDQAHRRWGALGHETVALVAENYLSPQAKDYVSNILGNETISTAATWADSYRETSAGRFSAGFHFVDANDSPPSSCSLDFTRDCSDAGGCVIEAIVNYTRRIQDKSLPDADCHNSLRFIIHFMGDVTQPLHCEGLDRGGNSIPVLFKKRHTNLHSVWDGSIPETTAGGTTLQVATSYAETIVNEIDSGIYADDASSWIACTDITTPEKCATSWAAESNAYVCTTVLPDGVPAVQDHDLSTTYYQTAAPVAQLQIARAGYRLAAWLNALAEADAQGELGMVYEKQTVLNDLFTV